MRSFSKIIKFAMLSCALISWKIGADKTPFSYNDLLNKNFNDRVFQGIFKTESDKDHIKSLALGVLDYTSAFVPGSDDPENPSILDENLFFYEGAPINSFFVDEKLAHYISGKFKNPSGLKGEKKNKLIELAREKFKEAITTHQGLLDPDLIQNLNKYDKELTDLLIQEKQSNEPERQPSPSSISQPSAPPKRGASVQPQTPLVVSKENLANHTATNASSNFSSVPSVGSSSQGSITPRSSDADTRNDESIAFETQVRELLANSSNSQGGAQIWSMLESKPISEDTDANSFMISAFNELGLNKFDFSNRTYPQDSAVFWITVVKFMQDFISRNNSIITNHLTNLPFLELITGLINNKESENSIIRDLSEEMFDLYKNPQHAFLYRCQIIAMLHAAKLAAMTPESIFVKPDVKEIMSGRVMGALPVSGGLPGGYGSGFANLGTSRGFDSSMHARLGASLGLSPINSPGSFASGTAPRVGLPHLLGSWDKSEKDKHQEGFALGRRGSLSSSASSASSNASEKSTLGRHTVVVP